MKRRSRMRKWIGMVGCVCGGGDKEIVKWIVWTGKNWLLPLSLSSFFSKLKLSIITEKRKPEWQPQFDMVQQPDPFSFVYWCYYFVNNVIENCEGQKCCLLTKSANSWKRFQKLCCVNNTELGVPAEPLSIPPPSSILDQLEADFPPAPPSTITSRLSAGIGEWRLPTNLEDEADEHIGQVDLLSRVFQRLTNYATKI